MVEQFRTEGGPAVREYCPHLTKLDCCRRATAPACTTSLSVPEAKAVLLSTGVVIDEQCVACYCQVVAFA